MELFRKYYISGGNFPSSKNKKKTGSEKCFHILGNGAF